MRVRISYAVDIEDVPLECARMLRLQDHGHG